MFDFPIMAKTNRIKLIEELQKQRNSTVICYITSDRMSVAGVPSLGTQMATDAVRYFRDLLQKVGKQDNIDLFIYSRGGHITAPPPIVHLIRKHCKKFGVLVPYKAHSAATLTCLGADEIVMGEMGQLSPIDPTTSNLFNPIDPLNPAGRWQISVEDVVAYIALAKEKAKLDTEESMKDVFRIIADKVHPIALGNVHRIYNLIRLLAPRLLSMHMDSSNIQEQSKIKLIVDTLTEKLYTHDYIISCEEAKEIGLKIINPNSNLDQAMWNLYEQYEKDLKLLEMFNPANILGTQQTASFREECAYLETAQKTFGFVSEGEIYPPPNLQQLTGMLNPQTVQQILPQLVQLAQQLPLYAPSVKIMTQQWLSL